MALAQAIKFRNLAAQLSPAETRSFVTELALSNPELIIQSLSSRFIHQSRRSEESVANTECNNILSTIIQSRDSDDSELCDNKLDTLPRRVIGICASFLDQASYAALSSTNRSTYLGCNTPILLQELTVKYLSDSSHVCLDISTFPFAKKLTLKVPPENDGIYGMGISTEKRNIIASQIAKMPRLQSLDLSNLSDMNAELIGIISSHEATNQRTKALFVALRGSQDDPFDRFISSITSFKHIQFLKLWIGIDRLVLHEESQARLTRALVELCSNLQGLEIVNSECGIEWNVLQSIGRRLEYLVLHDHLGRLVDSAEQQQIDFRNLRELQQGRTCPNNSIREITKTANNLEKVKLPFGRQDLVDEILRKCERLRYLEIEEVNRNYQMDEVLQSLERSLGSTNTMHRDKLKIRINTTETAIAECKECIVKLVRVSNALSVNPVDQWMIILYLENSKMDSSFIDDVRGALAADILDIAVLPDRNDQVILITNAGCTICGWRESWLMNL